MTAHTDISGELPCHVCGYDLRAHPQDGQCPECGASVAEALRIAAIPRRPPWRDSDPRWRRRIVAGAWILVFLPLMDVLRSFEWSSLIPVPEVFDFRGSVTTLEDTLVCGWPGVYQSLIFCVGAVLLFAKERGRRRGRLDWTRRWGVLCTYVVLLLSAAQILFIAALVMAGNSAVLMSIPLKYQPGITELLSNLSSGYLRFGPFPHDSSIVVLTAFSSITILLACFPLFDALRSTARKWVAAILLTPLALFSAAHLAQAGLYCFGFSSAADIYSFAVYFRPELMVQNIASVPTILNVSGSVFSAVAMESTKWLIVLTIAIWLSIAQLAVWWKRKIIRSN